MCNSTICKCAAIIVSIFIGAGAGLLAGFGLLDAAVFFTVPFMAILAAGVLLTLVVLFAMAACKNECKRLYKALCGDGSFIAATAVGTILVTLIALAIGIYSFIGFALFAIFFGIGFALFSMMVIGIFCFIKSFCKSKRECACNLSMLDE